MNDPLVNELRSSSTATDYESLICRCHEAADEIGRLRMEIVRLSTEQGESLMMIDRLRSLITAWADACDAGGGPEHIGAVDNLRKAVGR